MHQPPRVCVDNTSRIPKIATKETMIERVRKIVSRYHELQDLMASPEVSSDHRQLEPLGREYNSIGKSLSTYQGYLQARRNIDEAREIIAAESDVDLVRLAHEELQEQEEKLRQIEERIKFLLVPRDLADSRNAIMEIRSGTGGTEAGIFAADLYRMYTHYTETRGWRIEVLNTSEGELGSLKEIVYMVKGEGAYGSLKFESGVHRVQRVPQTESQGRVHTSAASVAVFPEADDVDIDLDPSDLRIDVYRSSGPGGQSVNTTDSAVRIVHLPSGTTVTCQDEKSQHKNKSKAMKVLKSRLLDAKRSEEEAKESASRKSMVGTGDRSAKIRTYNFPQGRVTDHRINLTLYKLETIVNGDIQALVDALSVADLNQRIKKGD